ncbi:hypothetical protein PISMIDRAFT_642914 [Pisolithus microcarpus 441]|uniref:Uncharacterized protein n=1 Tax=Pisolithus microcarpus 441 TaxID=765257 RepID=A0A0C9YK29_9AGAM|nr:hypothetical protein PISMIDRAFT_642914 [Pisolithus microcarpus 441]
MAAVYAHLSNAVIWLRGRLVCQVDGVFMHISNVKVMLIPENLVPFTKEALQSPNFCKQATAAQRLESEHKRLTKILNSTQESADQHKNEAECIQGALDEFKAKHETEFAQACKYAAGLQHDKSDFQSTLDAMKAEVAKANRQFGPKYGSPLTPGAASAQDFLTPVMPEVDDVFTTDGASTNRRKMDSSAVFQPENFEDIANISPDPLPSRPFQTANHPSKEIEDLQQCLQHAQRQIKKLTGSIHREKEMRIDYKRKLEASSGYVHDENEPPEDAMFDDDNTASIETFMEEVAEVAEVDCAIDSAMQPVPLPQIMLGKRI